MPERTSAVAAIPSAAPVAAVASHYVYISCIQVWILRVFCSRLTSAVGIKPADCRQLGAFSRTPVRKHHQVLDIVAESPDIVYCS